MNRLVRLFGSSIGRKIATAASGALLIAFLYGHMFGNLKVFQGPDALNGYAAWLQGHPLLWIFRIGLLTLFVIHIYCTVTLARDNRRARPVSYRHYQPTRSGVASRYMLLSGLVVVAFIVYHLLHFTLGVVDPANVRLVDDAQRLDVYSSLVRSFQNPWIAWSYVLAMVLLGLHLWHGTTSAFQTFGMRHESYDTFIRVSCALIVAVLVIGNSAIPILITAGVVAPVPGGGP